MSLLQGHGTRKDDTHWTQVLPLTIQTYGLNFIRYPMTNSTAYVVFASPQFDANDYANAILAGEPYQPAAQESGTLTRPSSGKISKQPSTLSGLSEPAKEDISVAISKLSVGIDDVSKQLKNVVTAHHEALLDQASSVGELEGKLQKVKSGLDEVTASQEKLRTKIRVPCTVLGVHAARLARLQCAADALRRTARFVVVARRLEAQMAELQRVSGEEDLANPTASAKNALGKPKLPDRKASEDLLNLSSEGEKERAIAKAALSVAELVALLEAPSESSPVSVPNDEEDEDGPESVREISLRSIRAVTGHIPAIESARTKITTEMETMVLTGLATLNRSLLASSLQTAYNLRVLPNLVQSLLSDLTDAVEQRIKLAFDMTRISKEVNAKEQAPTSHGLLYKSRVRTEPTNVTAPQWTAALWSRLESLAGELADCCIKVYTLEKVLQQKKDTVTQTNFMDEAMKVLESKPSTAFWSVLARTLERQCKEAARTSTFVQQTLSAGYPHLLRLFHDFFAKITVHTETTYTQDKQSPETIVILRALSVFEQAYLQRSTNKLNELVAQVLAGGARAPPAMSEGLSIARMAGNELDAAKFDPLLIKSVAKIVKSSLETLLTRIDPLIVRDRWATSLLGPVSTPQQAQNAQVATCLYHCSERLGKYIEEYPKDVASILNPQILEVRTAYEKIVDPLLIAIRRELSAIIGKLHKLDLSKAPDPLAGMGSSSTYIKDLAEKLNFVKAEVLAKFNVGDVSREWTTSIVKYVIRSFVLNASIAKPLGEGGKLQLTSDMTELEFALSAFMSEVGSQSKHGVKLDVIGDDYRTLRAIRPLLFLENRMLASPDATMGLPPLIVLHHILVRSPIPLPHALHGWSESEYVRWVDEHSQDEALTLIDGVLTHWEKVHDIPSKDFEASKEYLELAHRVIVRASGRNS